MTADKIIELLRTKGRAVVSRNEARLHAHEIVGWADARQYEILMEQPKRKGMQDRVILIVDIRPAYDPGFRYCFEQ